MLHLIGRFRASGLSPWNDCVARIDRFVKSSVHKLPDVMVAIRYATCAGEHTSIDARPHIVCSKISPLLPCPLAIPWVDGMILVTGFHIQYRLLWLKAQIVLHERP